MKKHNPKDEALRVLDERIDELQRRRDHAQYAGEAEKVDSLTRKLALVMSRAARLRRKFRE